ncbi:MAG: hypothetical protein WCV84_04560 [Patescibacteria group bacterium]
MRGLRPKPAYKYRVSCVVQIHYCTTYKPREGAICPHPSRIKEVTMYMFLQTGVKVKLLNVVFCRETYDGICMLAPLNPNFTFETERHGTVKLYQLSLRWTDLLDINPH